MFTAVPPYNDRGLHRGMGRIETRVRDEAIELCRSAPGAAVVALHHYPQRFRYPTLYPSGIPAATAIPLLDGIARANPATLVVPDPRLVQHCRARQPVDRAVAGQRGRDAARRRVCTCFAPTRSTGSSSVGG